MARPRILGLILLLLGILFGSRSMELIPTHVEEQLFRWEMILIGLGVYFLAVERKGSVGLILLVIGLFFWLPRLLDLPRNIGLWPILLIVIGGILLLKPRKRKKAISGSITPPGKRSKGGFVQESVLFGSNERIVTEEALTGADLMVLFGDARIDLTRCKWSEEGGRSIEVFILFGSSTLHVPPEWQLDMEVNSVFGSFKDLRSQKLIDEEDPKEKVSIKGLCLFGDGKVRD